ncbi:MAG: conjugal transfer protein TraL [Thiothrix sp.]|nr:conjugal transfer protein TraL [Thiothrix sp.]
MTTLHMVLQGKGGVGKSMISAMLAQYFHPFDEAVLGVDTDPVNATFAGFKALDVKAVKFMDGTKVVPSMFDQFTALIMNHDGMVVNDNGATSFLPLADYLISEEIFDLFLETGIKAVIHMVVVGGQALIDTVSGLNSIAQQFPEHVGLVVWKNEHFGPVESGGKAFEKLAVYEKNAHRINGIVTLHEQTELVRQAVRDMLTGRLTFREVEDASLEEYDFMKKRRIDRFRQSVFGQLDVLRTGGVL